MSDVEGLARRNLLVRLDPCPFPVRLGDRIDGPRERDADAEVIIDAMAADRMGAAAGDFPDDLRAL